MPSLLITCDYTEKSFYSLKPVNVLHQHLVAHTYVNKNVIQVYNNRVRISYRFCFLVIEA